MKLSEVVRVVALRKGKVKPTEFRLRPGERGLSLFAVVESPSLREVMAAVEAAGKRGELASALFTVREIHQLGLRLRFTSGGTSNPRVNAIHLEARLPWWREWQCLIRGPTIADFFNERLSGRLAAIARLAEPEDLQ